VTFLAMLWISCKIQIYARLRQRCARPAALAAVRTVAGQHLERPDRHPVAILASTPSEGEFGALTVSTSKTVSEA